MNEERQFNGQGVRQKEPSHIRKKKNSGLKLIIFLTLALAIIGVVVYFVLTKSKPEVSPALKNKDVSFSNIKDHDIRKDSYIQTFLDTSTNLYFSVFNILTNGIDNANNQNVNTEDIKPIDINNRKFSYPDFKDINFNPTVSDFFSKGKLDNFSLYGSGSFYRDEIACSKNNHTSWIFNDRFKTYQCQCQIQFMGNKCELENHYPSYLSIADRTYSNSSEFDSFVLGGSVEVDSISFPAKNIKNSVSCSDLCDKNESCTGFFIIPNNTAKEKKYSCQLIQNNLIRKYLNDNSNNIIIDPDVQPAVYLKKETKINDGYARPLFKDRIFVGSGNDVPLRFWNEFNYSEKSSAVDTILRKFPPKYLNYLPTYVFNDTGPDEKSSVIYGDSVSVAFSPEVFDSNTKFKTSTNVVKTYSHETFNGYFNVDLSDTGWTGVYVYLY